MSAYSYTYSGPDIYTEPILRFLEWLCRIGSRLKLSVSLWMNQAPREFIYSDKSINQVCRRVRSGKVWSLHISQNPKHGFTGSTSLRGVTVPFWAEIELVPERMPEKPSFGTFLSSIAINQIERYPTSVSVQFDLEWYDIPRNVEVATEIADAIKEVFCSSNGAYGYMVIFPDKTAHRLSLSLQEAEAYVTKLDSVVPGVFPVNLLSQEHIKKLGGKEKVMELFSACRIEDLSDEEDRFCIWLVENIGEFSPAIEAKYRPLFSPILVEGKKSDEG